MAKGDLNQVVASSSFYNPRCWPSLRLSVGQHDGEQHISAGCISAILKCWLATYYKPEAVLASKYVCVGQNCVYVLLLACVYVFLCSCIGQQAV